MMSMVGKKGSTLVPRRVLKHKFARAAAACGFSPLLPPKAVAGRKQRLKFCPFIQQLYPYVCNGFLRLDGDGDRDWSTIRKLNQGFNGRLTIR
jgi:hypothetical protein